MRDVTEEAQGSRVASLLAGIDTKQARSATLLSLSGGSLKFEPEPDVSGGGVSPMQPSSPSDSHPQAIPNYPLENGTPDQMMMQMKTK